MEYSQGQKQGKMIHIINHKARKSLKTKGKFGTKLRKFQVYDLIHSLILLILNISDFIFIYNNKKHHTQN